MLGIQTFKDLLMDRLHSEFLRPTQLIFFWIQKSIQGCQCNDSKMEDLSQLFCIHLNILRQPELTNCIISVIFKI